MRTPELESTEPVAMGIKDIPGLAYSALCKIEDRIREGLGAIVSDPSQVGPSPEEGDK